MICGEDRGLHLSHPLVHLDVSRELSQLARGKFEHPDITLLGRYRSFDNIDITLGCDGLRLDLLY